MTSKFKDECVKLLTQEDRRCRSEAIRRGIQLAKNRKGGEDNEKRR
jgi:hypothetical protein